MKTMQKTIKPKNTDGFTIVEVVVVVMLLAISIVPIVQAFAPVLMSGSFEEEKTVFTNQARGTLYRIMTLEFAPLDNNQGDPVDLAALFGWPDPPDADEAAKEDFTFKGRTYTPRVAITDASGGPGGLLQVTVTVEHVNLSTLMADY
jgi:type II secretory pathway pseudopilin PulG